MTKNIVNFAAAAGLTLCLAGSPCLAQTSIRLFGSTWARPSTNGTSSSNPVAFNSATVSLTCDTSNEAQIKAVLSSTPDGTGNVLVDNYINVTGAAGKTANVCKGGTSENGPQGVQNNCFNTTYEFASNGLIGQNLDTYASTGGIPPIDISSLLVSGSQQAKIDLVDTGILLANASLYLVTSCTQGGVTGPATITGNPISSNPTPDELTQNFIFNPTPGQDIGFTYDLSTSEKTGQLQITDGTIPTTSDSPLDPSMWQSKYVPGTSFATSSCVVHDGELLNGSPACKLFTLTCQVGTGSAAAGALCPLSQIRNEVFQDKFTGPAITLPDIIGPNGVTYHQGVGFLEATEPWTGGTCTFDSTSGLGDKLCPQNLLTSFSTGQSAATPSIAQQVSTTSKSVSALRIVPLLLAEDPDMFFDGTGTHPNSTFIAVSQVPEDLTTVTLQGGHPGGWINSHNFNVSLSSQPPQLPTTVPNYQNFVASPIQSITYGLTTADSVPDTKFPVSTDTTLTNSGIGCPTPGAPPSMPAGTFTPTPQSLSVDTDGQYLLHYFAQDCAGTEELKFVSSGNGGWTTSFYTVPVNVDTVAPVIASGPTFSTPPSTINGTPNAFSLNQAVTVSYRCTDDRAGVATCGTAVFSSPGTLDTGVVMTTLDTSSPGTKTLKIATTDSAGNAGTPITITYNVVTASASLAILQLAPATVRTGSTLTYDVLTVNLGPGTASGVVITDLLPPGTTFVSAGYEDVSCALFGGCHAPSSGSCSLSGGAVVCNAGQLKPLSLSSLNGIGVQIVVKVTAPAGTVLSNTITAGGQNALTSTSTRATVVRK